MRLLRNIIIASILAALLTGAGASTAPPTDWQSRVDPWVLSSAGAGETEFLIFLEQQAELSWAADLLTKEEKGRFVFQALTKVADQTQGDLIRTLKTEGADYQPYWVANMIWVRGDMALIQRIAGHPDAAHIYANPRVKLDVRAPIIESGARQESPSGAEAAETIPWNILHVNAPQVWEAGYRGGGVVIGGQDTGYAWEHPALKAQYRGWNGDTADHNYNWHDAIHANGDECGPDSPEPCDDHGHGTHTMGSMLGDGVDDDGDQHQVGMAPGARWIGCRNMDNGVGTPATYSECYQWFMAPTDLNGENPRPELAPDVINNSWSCPPGEGCTDPNVLLAVVENLRAAGILTVHSAGNSGSSCGSVNTPAGIYQASFTVGATDSSDNIAGFSSRGPVTVDSSNRLKPDISAPGVSILSSTRGGGYGTSSGTSMAAPHVAGQVALLISANPDLRGQVARIEDIIRESATPRTTSQDCGDVPGSQTPNNTYGWGRIDAWNALLHSGAIPLMLDKTPSSPVVQPGGTLGYTLTVTNTHPISSTTNVVLTDELPAGTTLVYASPPFTESATKVSWEFPGLEPQESRVFELVVRFDGPVGGNIRNENYWVSSDQTPGPIYGAPVSTPVRNLHYLLMIHREFHLSQ